MADDITKSVTEKAATYVAHRAGEPTTWAGVVSAAVGVYVALQAHDYQNAWIGAGAILAGLVSIFRKERKPK